jgi:hypothetical protein
MSVFSAIQRVSFVVLLIVLLPTALSFGVEDNAAMQTEPPNAAPPERKRCRFQFRLRTLMIGVTLLAVPRR